MKFTVTYELAIPDWADLEERALYHEVDARGALYAIEAEVAAQETDSGNVYLIRMGDTNRSLGFDTEVDVDSDIVGAWTWYMNDEAGHGVTLEIQER